MTYNYSDDFKEKVTLALKTLRNFSKPDHKKAIVQMITSFVPFLALWVLMYFTWDYSKIGFYLLAFLNAFFLVRIFIIQHDCGHQSYVKSKFWRDTIGVVCSLFSTIPYHYWAKSHDFHHGHNGMLDHRDIGDIDTLTVAEYDALPKFKQFLYRIYRSFPVMFILGPIYYILIHNRLPLITLPQFKKERIRLYLSNALIVGVVIGVSLLLDWKKVVITHLSIVCLFSIIAIWFFYVQHQHEEGYKHWKNKWEYLYAAVKGSTFYKLPKFMHWFTGNIGYHHIHHLNPAIPSYKLPDSIASIPWFHKFTTEVTFLESLKLASHKLWDEQSERMITFKEYYQMKKMQMA
ncbi:MAG TPA: fatty acid desaturase [Saprospiraceae bacterium]|nr:fatty acid desaturase [Saprospiraceae bacterium]